MPGTGTASIENIILKLQDLNFQPDLELFCNSCLSNMESIHARSCSYLSRKDHMSWDLFL
jgi:hypothetical protein